MGGSEAVAFLIICFAALVMAKIVRRVFRRYGLPVGKAMGKDFWKGALWGFLAISGTLLGIFTLHDSASQDSPCMGGQLCQR